MSSPPPKLHEDPAEDAAVLLLRIGLAVLALGVPVSTALSRRLLFILMPVGAALVLIAGVLLSDAPIRARLRDTFLSRSGLCGVGLIGWGVLSIVWSPVGPDASLRLAKVAGTLLLVIVTAAFLPERTRTSNMNLFPVGVLAAVFATIGTVLNVPGGALAAQADDSTLERAVVSLVVLVWPALGALAIRERWVSATVVVVCVAAAAITAWTSVALAALALGAFTFAVATLHPGRAGRVLGVAAAALFLLGPLVPFGAALVLKGLGTLAGDRLPDLTAVTLSMRVWADLVVREPVRLITGHGIGMAALAPSTGFLPPETPKSLLFEVWYDYGVIGAVLAAALLYGAFGVVGRLSPAVAPFVLAELVAALTIAFNGLDTTQLWWMTLLGLAALAFTTVVRGEIRTTRPVARLEPQITPLSR